MPGKPHSKALKLEVARSLARTITAKRPGGKPSVVAEKHNIKRDTLYTWRDKDPVFGSLLEQAKQELIDQATEPRLDGEFNELEAREIAQQIGMARLITGMKTMQPDKLVMALKLNGERIDELKRQTQTEAVLEQAAKYLGQVLSQEELQYLTERAITIWAESIEEERPQALEIEAEISSVQ